MNYLIDAFLDNNIGDNIMVETLIDRLKSNGIKCFLLANNEFTYSDIIRNHPDVEVVEVLNKKTIVDHQIEGYIRIGGSIFPHNNIREGILRYFTLAKYKMLKSKGVKIFILGCNLGPFISSIGVFATNKILQLADLITCRDQETYEYIGRHKKKDFYLYPDIVFNRLDLCDNYESKNVLGISTYTGYTKKLRKHNFSYCKLMSEIINKFLNNDTSATVKLFVFDTGFNSDFPTTYRIYDQVKYKERVEIISFNGDIKLFMEEYNKCSMMIGARFHSIILSLLCKIPILPIIYSNKTKNLLEDLNYNGARIIFSKCEDSDTSQIIRDISSKENLLCDLDQQILEESKGHFNVLNKYLDKSI